MLSHPSAEGTAKTACSLCQDALEFSSKLLSCFLAKENLKKEGVLRRPHLTRQQRLAWVLSAHALVGSPEGQTIPRLRVANHIELRCREHES